MTLYSHEILQARILAAAAKSLQSCPTLCDPIDSSPSGSPVPGILQARTLEWVAISFSKNTGVGTCSLLQGIFPTQGLNPGLPHCRWIFYQLSHNRSPKILGWVSLSLLQWIFPTQESNPGLLHYRQMLYQLSYEGSP